MFPNHNFTADPYFNFTMQPGERRCFDIAIFNDNMAENKYEHLYYSIGVYTPIPFHSQRARIRIEDDEGKKIIALCSVPIHKHDMKKSFVYIVYIQF